jgi:hypothetical protein
MPKKPTVTVTIETPTKDKKKRAAPSTAFREGNPYRFQVGHSKKSPNPAGRPPDEMRLISRSLRAQLPHRAPDAVASALNLSPGASWAQCISASLLRRAVRGDNNAVSIILNATEPASRNGLDPMGLDRESMGGVVPELHISLVQARPIEAPQPTTISANLEESTRAS